MTKRITVKTRKDNYHHLLAEIFGHISRGRNLALRQINTAQVVTYWHIGRAIVEYEQHGKSRAEYGDELMDRLSSDMSARFDRGFSQTNLKMMRLFYQSFRIRQTLSDEFKPQLSWSHYCELLKEDNPSARKFYKIEAVEAPVPSVRHPLGVRHQPEVWHRQFPRKLT